MNIIERQKNYKLPKNFIFNKDSKYYWSGTSAEALDFLTFIPYYENAKPFFEECDFKDTIKNEIQKWDLTTILKSSLYFYFETKIEKRRKMKTEIITIYDWQILASLIIHSKLSDTVLLFIKELGLMHISTEKMIISGSFHALDNIFVFEQRVLNKETLKKLLEFLKVDIASADSLVNEAFKNKSVKKIAAFLYTFESGLDKNLILTEYLINYKIYNNTKIQSQQKKNLRSNQLLELERNSLENFDIFDMFDSFEVTKSKASEISYFVFHEQLFDDFTNNPKGSSIQIFKLFEEFLYSSNDKAVFIKDFSIKNLNEIINKFCFLYKKQIEKIIQIEKALFNTKLSLEQTVMTVVIVALAIFSSAMTSMERRATNPVLPSVNVAMMSRRDAPALPSDNLAMVISSTPTWAQQKTQSTEARAMRSLPAQSIFTPAKP